MDTIVRVLVYMAAGLALLAANVWFVRSMIQVVGGTEPRAIGAFSVSGKDDPNSKLGIALARMLVAKVHRIGKEMKAASLAIESARKATRTGVVRPLVDMPDVPLTIPSEIFQPLDMNLSVGGVEVGGVLSWLQNAMMKERVLIFSVQYADDKAYVAGQVPGGAPFFIEDLAPKHTEIVEAVAYSLVQDQLSRTIPQMAALQVTDVKALLTSLQAAADLESRVALGLAAGGAFAPLLDKLDELSSKMPGWIELRQVTAEIAEKAGDDAKALAYYETLLADTDDSLPYNKTLANKVAQISARLQQARAAKAVVATASAVPPGPAIGPAQSPRLASLLAAPSTARVLELAGIKSLQMPRPVRIAVLGGLPAGVRYRNST